jgi:hypothetical protein
VLYDQLISLPEITYAIDSISIAIVVVEIIIHISRFRSRETDRSLSSRIESVKSLNFEHTRGALFEGLLHTQNLYKSFRGRAFTHFSFSELSEFEIKSLGLRMLALRSCCNREYSQEEQSDCDKARRVKIADA